MGAACYYYESGFCEAIPIEWKGIQVDITRTPKTEFLFNIYTAETCSGAVKGNYLQMEPTEK
jgi:hypothetical protein